MYYVYILKSETDASRYVGVSQNLQRRLLEHNNVTAKYSRSKRPYKLIWYSVFSMKKKAYAFEKYLKSSSGYAFTKKHLI